MARTVSQVQSNARLGVTTAVSMFRLREVVRKGERTGELVQTRTIGVVCFYSFAVGMGCTALLRAWFCLARLRFCVNSMFFRPCIGMFYDLCAFANWLAGLPCVFVWTSCADSQLLPSFPFSALTAVRHWLLERQKHASGVKYTTEQRYMCPIESWGVGTYGHCSWRYVYTSSSRKCVDHALKMVLVALNAEKAAFACTRAICSAIAT